MNNLELIDHLLDKVFIPTKYDRERCLEKKDKDRKLYLHLLFKNPAMMNYCLTELYKISQEKDTIITAKRIYEFIYKYLEQEVDSYNKSELVRLFLEQNTSK